VNTRTQEISSSKQSRQASICRLACGVLCSLKDWVRMTRHARSLLIVRSINLKPNKSGSCSGRRALKFRNLTTCKTICNRSATTFTIVMHGFGPSQIRKKSGKENNFRHTVEDSRMVRLSPPRYSFEDHVEALRLLSCASY